MSDLEEQRVKVAIDIKRKICQDSTEEEEISNFRVAFEAKILSDGYTMDTIIQGVFIGLLGFVESEGDKKGLSKRLIHTTITEILEELLTGRSEKAPASTDSADV